MKLKKKYTGAYRASAPQAGLAGPVFWLWDGEDSKPTMEKELVPAWHYSVSL